MVQIENLILIILGAFVALPFLIVLLDSVQEPKNYDGDQY